jgi:hypothetical protein
MTPIRIRPSAAIALGTVILIACREQEPAVQPVETTPPAEAPAPAAEVTVPPTTVRLEERNRSGITGEATATHTLDSVTIVLNLQGLQAGQEYPAHVHTGSCEQGGPPVVPLNPVRATQGGSGSSRTTAPAARLSPEQPAFIQVHGTNGSPVACADHPGHGEEGAGREDTTGRAPGQPGTTPAQPGRSPGT